MSYNVKKPRKPLRPFAGFHIIYYFCTYMKKTIISLMGLLVLVIAASAQEENNVVVNTTQGQVSGIIQEGTKAYLGIPYAKVERFMPPLSVEPWKGIRACDHWGPMVMQQTWGKQLYEDEMSEQNSCVLNVWTTDVNACQPVMLWLHGGGFDSDTSKWHPGMQLLSVSTTVSTSLVPRPLCHQSRLQILG